MNHMFFCCENFNIKCFDSWDVSNVTDMSGLFVRCKYFNGDLSKWNVSNVKATVNMFAGCYKFNGDLSNWDVSNLEDMKYMFNQCFAFRGKGLEHWDVSKVKDMTNAFRMCKNLQFQVGIKNKTLQRESFSHTIYANS